MAFFVQVQNGVVVNRISVADPATWPHDSSWYQNDIAQIGWYYKDGVFSPNAPVPPTPAPNNYSAMIQRRANAQAAAGDPAGALFTLKSIGE